jgi:hypothetical protein
MANSSLLGAATRVDVEVHNAGDLSLFRNTSTPGRTTAMIRGIEHDVVERQSASATRPWRSATAHGGREIR